MEKRANKEKEKKEEKEEEKKKKRKRATKEKEKKKKKKKRKRRIKEKIREALDGEMRKGAQNESGMKFRWSPDFFFFSNFDLRQLPQCKSASPCLWM